MYTQLTTKGKPVSNSPTYNTSETPSLDELISLKQASELCGLSMNQLRLLVSRGVIWGRKLGRNWYTTASAVQAYMELDRRPGPKPNKKTP